MKVKIDIPGRICKQCGKEIPSNKHYGAEYCSSECSNAWWVEYYRKKSRNKESKYPEQSCAMCGEMFQPRSANQIYCNPICAAKYQIEVVLERGRFVVFERDGFRCFYCGKVSFIDWVELHADHIHPKSHGGRDVAGNLVTACKRCNLEKGNNILSNEDEILQEIKRRNGQKGLGQDQHIKL